MTGRNLFYAITLLAVAISISSCNDNEQVIFEADADVYWLSKMNDGEIQHGVYYFAYGNNPINTVTVTLPGGEEIDLDKSFNAATTWANEPDSVDFKGEFPEAGSYLFNVVSESGETVQVSEMLEIDSLEIPVFTQVEYNDTILGYNLEWDDVEGAEAYLVKLINEDGVIVYNSYAVNGDVNAYNILQGGSGYWDESPSANETYVLQILAYLFDDDADNSNYVYNVQQISMGETTIVWGEE
ncbi:MAG TPA: hypothetical protein VKA10_11995 [Prolixibacteraceae bacterium]|nr:hypothetical protein [Prolixibacteraceae bacterium]